MKGSNGSYTLISKAQISLPQEKETVSFLAQMSLEAEPTSFTLISICTFCLTLRISLRLAEVSELR
jgi:hypothetical protein